MASSGKLWSIPFDPAAGLQFDQAKSIDISPIVDFSNMVFTEDGKLAYGIDTGTGEVRGFVMDGNGGLRQAPGASVLPRNARIGSWVALALGRTLQ